MLVETPGGSKSYLLDGVRHASITKAWEVRGGGLPAPLPAAHASACPELTCRLTTQAARHAGRSVLEPSQRSRRSQGSRSRLRRPWLRPPREATSGLTHVDVLFSAFFHF